jgi:hypothetical protein
MLTPDMQANVLNLCYAQLELDYGYIRAVTPYYSIYDISFRSEAARQKVYDDDTYYAKLVRQYWRGKSSGSCQVNIIPPQFNS